MIVKVKRFKNIVIMDYKEKYEMALEGIQEILSSGEDSIKMSRLQLRLQGIFPELKESAGELTWLTRFIKEEAFSLSMDIRNNEDRIKLKKLQKSLEWLEKQVEQKPVDKVKPTKFNVGDWVVNKGHSYLIADIDFLDNRYLFEIGGYTHEQLNWEYIENVDKNYHLWSIKDAKEGDVLEFEDHGRVVVGVVSFVSEKTGKVDVSCLLEDNNFKIGNFYALDTINPHPATKEQRETLFKAMHEAGYEQIFAVFAIGYQHGWNDLYSIHHEKGGKQ